MIRTMLALLPAGNGARVAWHLVLTVVSVALRAASAVLLVPLVSALFSPTPADAWRWVGWLSLAIVSCWIVDWVIARIAFSLGFSVLQSGQRDLAARLARVRLTWLDAENTATARQAVASVGPELVGLFIYLATPLLSGVLLPVAIALALMPVSPWLGFAALAGVPVLLGAYWLSGRLSRAADRAASEANATLSERILEFARTQQALRAAGRVEPARSQVGDALNRQHGAMLRLIVMQIPGQIIFSVATQLALVLLAGTTVWLALSGGITAPEAVALIVVIARYLEPFTALAGLAAATEGSTSTLRRISEVTSAPVDPVGDQEVAFVEPPRVTLRDVSFGYGERSGGVIEGLNMTFEAGTTTAIVGPSGSGKSTILALLAGLYQPERGAITIDGVDASELTAEARRELVSVVFQQPYLFDTDIRENLLAGNPGAEEEKLALVTGLARVDGIVRRLPDGLGSRVGESGGALSGGERQRVSIARALLKPAPVLLVDEATSALDNENEAAVAAALNNDPTPRTRVIIAHRLSSIRAADRVIFIDAGRVVEDGTYEELVGAGGRFAEFHRHQHEAAKWRL